MSEIDARKAIIDKSPADEDVVRAPDQPPVARGVAGSRRAEHAAAYPDDFRLAGAAVRIARHRNNPLSSMVGVADSAAVSASRIASSRFTPSGICWILSCNLRMASISISGRGGQPGR